MLTDRQARVENRSLPLASRAARRVHLPLLALALLSLVAGCKTKEDPLETFGPMERQASAAVPWATAKAPARLSLLEAPASVAPPAEAEARLSPPVATRISEVMVQVGDEVEKGAPLAKVVMPEVLEAAGRLAAANIRVEAQRKVRAQLEGLKEHGLVRAPDLADAEAALGDARAERIAALAVLQGAGLSEADGAKMLSSGGETTLRSPIAGIVLQVDAPIGAVRDEGGPPLFRIGAATSGRVVARLSAAIPEDSTYEWQAQGQAPIPLTLVSRSPVLESGTREVFLASETPLTPGAFGKLLVHLPPDTEAVAIPARAIFLREGAAHVYLREGETVREVQVQVLSSSGSDALVEGLSPGDRVAADAGRYAASMGEQDEP